MPSGMPLTETQKKFIIENKDDMFYNQIAGEIGVNQPTVRRFVKDYEREQR